jgi:hypothetical protein
MFTIARRSAVLARQAPRRGITARAQALSATIRSQALAREYIDVALVAAGLGVGMFICVLPAQFELNAIGHPVPKLNASFRGASTPTTEALSEVGPYNRILCCIRATASPIRCTRPHCDSILLNQSKYDDRSSFKIFGHYNTQVNKMLGARYTNYGPAALDAGLMPLLIKMLAEPDEDSSVRSAVMRSLRLITSKAIGARTMFDTEGLHQTVLDACVKSALEWRSHNEPLRYAFTAIPSLSLSEGDKEALRAATDAMHIAANLWTTAGSSAFHMSCIASVY